jgi:hypothetical protein
MTPEFDKEHYKRLKRMAKQFKVHITQYVTPPEYVLCYNGFTVAFSPATELNDNRMLEVSISYCAPEDTFKKKVGKYHALRKFFEENNYIHLPLGPMYRLSVEDTKYSLQEMFNV